jgi:osmotically inducible protein OsmC
MTKNTANVHWDGGIKDGHGRISTGRDVLHEVPYGFDSRFGSGPNTNPEELIAAAHAACFSMALSKELGDRDINAPAIETDCEVTLDEQDGGFAITKSHLKVELRAPGADRAKAEEAVESAAKNCPVSKLLSCEITHEAHYDL